MTFAILSGLLLLVFGAFGMATSLFQDTEVRQGTENQLRSIKLLLQRDLELSDFWLMSIAPRSTADGDRDALCVSALSDWADPVRFDSTTDRPRWDRRVVWYATREPDARLYRQVVEPGGVLSGPYADLTSNLSEVNPEGNQDVVYSRILSRGVRNFRVTNRLQNGTVTVDLKLLAEGRRRPNTATKTQENLEITLVFQPRNTFPKI